MGSVKMWEILVPTTRADGRPYRTRYHRVWDEKVRAITGGLTVLPVVRGQWVSPNKQLFTERMIPVRIATSRENIEKIADMTMAYYEQQAVMAYRVSDEVILRHRVQPKIANEVEDKYVVKPGTIPAEIRNGRMREVLEQVLQADATVKFFPQNAIINESMLILGPLPLELDTALVGLGFAKQEAGDNPNYDVDTWWFDF